MYFPYFHSFAPQKSFKVDNYWMIMEFFGKQISKCPNVMMKRTCVPAYRLLLSLSNELILFLSHYESPCKMKFVNRSSVSQSVPPPKVFIVWFFSYIGDYCGQISPQMSLETSLKIAFLTKWKLWCHFLFRTTVNLSLLNNKTSAGQRFPYSVSQLSVL